MKKLTETETNRQYVAFLEANGCFVWRNNTGCMKSGGRFVKFGKLGSGDVIGMTSTGRFISIENKSNGEPVSNSQAEFANWTRAKGGIALFVTGLDDLVLQTEGLLR